MWKVHSSAILPPTLYHSGCQPLTYCTGGCPWCDLRPLQEGVRRKEPTMKVPQVQPKPIADPQHHKDDFPSDPATCHIGKTPTWLVLDMTNDL
nr:PREDICTED: uncharacterized protein LOC103315188 isoform X3 [Tribolium castaneum]|eukprot:XP_015840498.1 PREDICTED: uncharacterized protein LOC103315188 isoform X3 [Tribolium castaneum]